ncbi:hypothetical protein JOM56_005133 [Amanita muscaria]
MVWSNAIDDIKLQKPQHVVKVYQNASVICPTVPYLQDKSLQSPLSDCSTDPRTMKAPTRSSFHMDRPTARTVMWYMLPVRFRGTGWHKAHNLPNKRRNSIPCRESLFHGESQGKRQLWRSQSDDTNYLQFSCDCNVHSPRDYCPYSHARRKCVRDTRDDLPLR